MKKSQIAVLAAVGMIVAIMIIVMGVGRIAVGTATSWDSSRSGKNDGASWSDASKQMALRDFDTIVVEGAWEVRVKHADAYSVNIDYPSSMEDSLQVQVKGRRLVLGTHDGGNWHGDDLVAWIEMPSLVEIRIEGAAHAVFEGFDEDRLDVVIDGAGQVEGADSEVGQLNATLKGLGQIDLGEVKAENAYVALDGAGEIVVMMNGGVLDGRLQGLGSIVYLGEASDEKIQIDGLGEVSHNRR